MHVLQEHREPPVLVSVAEAARLLGLSERYAWKLIARQELRSIRLGGRRMVPRAEVDRLATVEGR
jgi:excisionase family DNA binding protein